jgi:hypothetical protein
LKPASANPFPHSDRLADLRHRHQKILDELAAQADQPSADVPAPSAIDPRARLDDLKTRHESSSPAVPSL